MKALSKIMSLIRKECKVDMLNIYSNPIIIKAINNTDETQYGVEFLEAIKNIVEGNTCNGNISIVYGISSISIKEFYFWLTSKELKVNIINVVLYHKVDSEVISIKNKDVKGNEIYIPFKLVIDNHQFQSNQASIFYKFKIDGFTSLKINMINPNEEVAVYIYLSDDFKTKKATYYFWNPMFWKIKKEEKV